MQLIAETYALLQQVLGLDYPAMQAAFAEWNRGELDSYLIQITAEILGKRDPETGQPIVEVILDRAGQKGTGGWTVAAALDLGVPVPTIAEAVAARSLSALKPQRVAAAGKLAGPAQQPAPDLPLEARREALRAGKLCAYAQGCALLAGAAQEHDWALDFGTVATIWRGGCIIRARFLNRIKDAFDRDPALTNLLVDPWFADLIGRGQASLREVVAAAARHGVPAPALASALAYFDGYRAARLPASLIQAQRDYFGAHTYERVDRDGSFHSDWPAL
jgi:6-phosphogluconate dehydrogenase